MKRILMAILCVFAVMISVSCYAQITEADLNIGGIYYGQSMADVIKKLGEPIRIEKTPPHGSAPVFRYKNSEILVRCAPTVPVWGANTISGNEFFTPAGIGIGSTYDAVIKAYGKADFDSFITYPNAQIHTLKFIIPKKGTAHLELGFIMTPDKKVTRIYIYEDDGSDNG